jgi:hypothetical protein
VGRGSSSYKITYEDLKDKLNEDGVGPPAPDPTEIKQPTVIAPPDGAGIGGDVTYTPKTSAITGTSEFLPSNSDYLGGTVEAVGSTDYVSNQNNWDGLFTGSLDDKKVVLNNPAGNAIVKYTWSSTAPISSIQIKFKATGGTGVVQLVKTDGSLINDVFTFDTSATVLSAEVNEPIKGFRVQQQGGSSANIELYNVAFNEQPWGTPLEILTLANANTYNNADGTDTGQPISETFTAGQTVYGQNATGTYGTESPAFTTTLYTGNSDVDANGNINTGIDNTGKALVWTKTRTNLPTASYNNHMLADTVVTAPGVLKTNKTDAIDASTTDKFGFVSYGFNPEQQNQNGYTYVAWNFRAAPGFFDIVTYEGDATAGRTVAHSLGSIPGMMIIKKTSGTGSWAVYHRSTGNSSAMFLNQTDAAFSSPLFNNTTPTSTEFTVNNGGNVNGSGDSYVAYLFADTPGKIKCDFYKGTGSGSDNPIDCGFKPGWLLLKASGLTENWLILDRERSDSALYPNTSGDESSSFSSQFEWTDTGFKVKGAGAYFNGGNQNYIYIAIAENVTAGEFAPTGTLTADADDSGPTITLTDVTGEWEPGMEVVNDTEATKTAPGADVLEFVGSTPQDDPDGSVDTWGNATWQVSTDSAFTTPMEATKLINDPDTNQVLLETERGAITLEGDTEYWVRVKYAATSPNAESTYSAANHFKTAAGSSGAYGNFSTTLYPGNGGSGGETQVIDTGVDNTDKALVWIKSTDFGTDHILVDTERGEDESLTSNATAKQKEWAGSGVQSFDSSGFTLGADNSYAEINKTGRNYVAWNFAAAEGFFDVVTYDGNGGTQEVPHSLGNAPGLIICKNYNTVNSWGVWHKDLPANTKLYLNDASAADSTTTGVQSTSNSSFTV